MRIGVPKELKPSEGRIALVPAAVKELVGGGHVVSIEMGAGSSAGFPDQQYAEAGARIRERADEVWRSSELVVKVKEPLPAEYGHFRDDLTLFAFLHLAADPILTDHLVRSGTRAIAFETVEERDRRLPILMPMSAIAGKLAAYAATQLLQTPRGGPGKLLAGVPGIRPATVGIIGGGVVGTAVAQTISGAGGEVTVLERSQERLYELEALLGQGVRLVHSDATAIENTLDSSDVVVGAVLVPGVTTPRLVSRELLEKTASPPIMIDVAIDQGGAFDTSRPTTHDEPVFLEANALHYCVTNMPGAVPESASAALSNALIPYVCALADGVHDGPTAAALDRGLNVEGGAIRYPGLEESVSAARS